MGNSRGQNTAYDLVLHMRQFMPNGSEHSICKACVQLDSCSHMSLWSMMSLLASYQLWQVIQSERYFGTGHAERH